MQDNTFKVFTRRVAYELRKMGFICLKVEPNYKTPFYDVYSFENSPELQQAIKNINANR